MSERRIIGFGAVNDEAEEFKPKEGRLSVVFGLNQNLKLSKFEYNPTASSDGSPQNAIDIAIETPGENPILARFFEPTKVYDNTQNRAIDDDGSDAWAKAINQSKRQLGATMSHIVKSVGVTQQQLDNAFKNEVGFADYAKILEALVKDKLNTEVDVFLEYQSSIKSGQDKTYLTLPQNMKGGRFMEPHIEPVGEWTEETSWSVEVEGKTITREGLRYVDNDGNVHPFERNKRFMESPKAVQQVKGGQKKGILSSSAKTINSSAKPQASTWGND